MLHYPERQQVGLTKQMYANIEFRGAGGFFSNIVFNACLIHISWKSWASYLSLSWGTVGRLRGGTISSIYGLLLVLTLATPLRNLVPTTVHVPT